MVFLFYLFFEIRSTEENSIFLSLKDWSSSKRDFLRIKYENEIGHGDSFPLTNATFHHFQRIFPYFLAHFNGGYNFAVIFSIVFLVIFVISNYLKGKHTKKPNALVCLTSMIFIFMLLASLLVLLLFMFLMFLELNELNKTFVSSTGNKIELIRGNIANIIEETRKMIPDSVLFLQSLPEAFSTAESLHYEYYERILDHNDTFFENFTRFYLRMVELETELGNRYTQMNNRIGFIPQFFINQNENPNLICPSGLCVLGDPRLKVNRTDIVNHFKDVFHTDSNKQNRLKNDAKSFISSFSQMNTYLDGSARDFLHYQRRGYTVFKNWIDGEFSNFSQLYQGEFLGYAQKIDKVTSTVSLISIIMCIIVVALSVPIVIYVFSPNCGISAVSTFYGLSLILLGMVGGSYLGIGTFLYDSIKSTEDVFSREDTDPYQKMYYNIFTCPEKTIGDSMEFSLVSSGTDTLLTNYFDNEELQQAEIGLRCIDITQNSAEKLPLLQTAGGPVPFYVGDSDPTSVYSKNIEPKTHYILRNYSDFIDLTAAQSDRKVLALAVLQLYPNEYSFFNNYLRDICRSSYGPDVSSFDLSRVRDNCGSIAAFSVNGTYYTEFNSFADSIIVNLLTNDNVNQLYESLLSVYNYFGSDLNIAYYVRSTFGGYLNTFYMGLGSLYNQYFNFYDKQNDKNSSIRSWQRNITIKYQEMKAKYISMRQQSCSTISTEYSEYRKKIIVTITQYTGFGLLMMILIALFSILSMIFMLFMHMNANRDNSETETISDSVSEKHQYSTSESSEKISNNSRRGPQSQRGENSSRNAMNSRRRSSDGSEDSERGVASSRNLNSRGPSNNRDLNSRGIASRRGGDDRGMTSRRGGDDRGMTSRRGGDDRGMASRRGGDDRGMASRRGGDDSRNLNSTRGMQTQRGMNSRRGNDDERNAQSTRGMNSQRGANSRNRRESSSSDFSSEGSSSSFSSGSRARNSRMRSRR